MLKLFVPLSLSLSLSLLLLSSFLSYSQTGKTHLVSMQSSFGNGTQYFTLYAPNDSAQGVHPVIICANGVGENKDNIFISASGSIGDYCRKGAFPWQYNTITNQMCTFYVLEIHKPASSAGNFEPTRFKDAIDWVYKNLPNADKSQVYLTGLSLSGGGLWSFLQGNNGDTTNSYMNKIAAVAPITGTQDAYDAFLYKALNNSNLPLTAYETLDDANAPTKGTTQHYEIYGNIYSTTYPIAVKNNRFIYPLTGGHGGAWQKAYDTGQAVYPIQGNPGYKNNPNLYVWFLSKSRPNLKTTLPVVVPPVVIPPVTTTKTILYSMSFYNPDGTILVSITVYTDGSVISSKN